MLIPLLDNNFNNFQPEKFINFTKKTSPRILKISKKRFKFVRLI